VESDSPGAARVAREGDWSQVQQQLAISPQCGFGGSADNAFMTPDEQWKKLELLVRVADRVWGSVAAQA